MAVTANKKSSSKLISVDSNEGLILVNEKRIPREADKASLDNINTMSDSNYESSCLSFSAADSRNIPVEKSRPCSGSSILKRSSRPSSGHSVKFVESETIIPIQTNSNISPSAKNSEFKKTTLETITQQEPLTLPNESMKDTVLKNDSLLLIDTRDQHSKISIPGEKQSKSSQFIHIPENNHKVENAKQEENTEPLDSKLNSTLIHSKENCENQHSSGENRDNEYSTLIGHHKKFVKSDNLTETKLTEEEIQDNFNKIERCQVDGNNLPSSSNQATYSDSKTNKDVPYRRKRAVFNAEHSPSDGDMSREGYYKANENEIERRHIRHKSLKQKMLDENESEENVTNVVDYQDKEKLEIEISQIKINSQKIPTQKKKRLYELYEELKRVRDAIAQMYSLEESEKDLEMEEENVTCDDNTICSSVQDGDNNIVKDPEREETTAVEEKITAELVELSAGNVRDEDVDTVECNKNEREETTTVGEKFQHENVDTSAGNVCGEDVDTSECSKNVDFDVADKSSVLSTDDSTHNLLKPSVVKNNDLIQSENTNEITKEREQITPGRINELKLINHNNENSESSSEKVLVTTATDINWGQSISEVGCTIENNEMSVKKTGNEQLYNEQETTIVEPTMCNKSLSKESKEDEQDRMPILCEKMHRKEPTGSLSFGATSTCGVGNDVTNTSNNNVDIEHSGKDNACSYSNLSPTDETKDNNETKEKSVFHEDVLDKRISNLNKTNHNYERDNDRMLSSALDDENDLDREVNLDFLESENAKEATLSKNVKENDVVKDRFSDSALLMSPKEREDDFFDCDEDLSDNDDSLPDTPKVIYGKQHKEAANVANKIIKDILCGISDMEESRKFRKEFKSIAGEQEEISCIVFCDPDDSYNVNVIRDINCSNIDPLIVPSVVGDFELLVSSITQLSSSVTTECKDVKLKVRLPFMKSEMKYFHCPVLRWLSPSRQWIDIPSVDYIYEDEEGCILPILEAEIKQLGVFAIVAAAIKERFVFSYDVHEVSSAVDRETVLAGSYCPRFYSTETQADLVVIPIERSVIDDSKVSEIEDSSLLVASSALVIVDLLNDPPQPLTLYILCSKPKSRPWTASMTSRIGTAESGYLSGSRIVSRAKSRENIKHFLECWYDSDNYIVRITDGCLGVKSTLIQKKDLTKDDKVRVTLHEKHNKYLIVEMKKEARRPDVNAVVVNLLKTLREHRVYICVAQRRDNPRYIKVLCDLKSKVTTRMIIRLERDHYIKRILILATEGDVISLNLRGNIKTVPNRKRLFRLYAVNGFVTDYEIQVVDQYSQRTLQKYCGFLQISICTSKSFEGEPIFGYEEQVKWKLLTEIPVTLPKDSSLYDYEKVFRTRLCLKYKGPITIEFLRSFARLIGKEWYTLARGLRLEHVRIQSIAQQNKRSSLESLVYDLLLTWLKRSCHSTDKAVVLATALRRSGRFDLAEEIKDMDRTYKKDYYKVINDRRLDKAIYLTSRSRAVLRSWRYLGSFLQFSQEEMNEIDNTESNEIQKCERLLRLWRGRGEPHQGPQALTAILRRAGFFYIADHIAVVTRWRPKTSV